MALAVVPAAAFTASILFDVLSLVADNREQAHAYQRHAADFMRVGIGSALASNALEAADYLRAQVTDVGGAPTRKFALNGAVIVVYLLDLAARQGRAGNASPQAPRVDALPIGLSLLGLALLGVGANLE
jgi:hypothetical protein